MVEIVEPPEARAILARVGAALVSTYGPADEHADGPASAVTSR
jgi:uncharacterized protein YqfA (UPF0365 family)